MLSADAVLLATVSECAGRRRAVRTPTMAEPMTVGAREFLSCVQVPKTLGPHLRDWQQQSLLRGRVTHRPV
jgi:hypothetical protein